MQTITPATLNKRLIDLAKTSGLVHYPEEIAFNDEIPKHVATAVNHIGSEDDRLKLLIEIANAWWANNKNVPVEDIFGEFLEKHSVNQWRWIWGLTMTTRGCTFDHEKDQVRLWVDTPASIQRDHADGFCTSSMFQVFGPLHIARRYFEGLRDGIVYGPNSCTKLVEATLPNGVVIAASWIDMR